VLSIELIMVLPILLIVLLAMVEFGILLMSSQGIGAAASIGSRNAALPSSSLASVQAAVDTALQGYIWQDKTELVVFVDEDGNGPGGFVADTGLILANAPSGAIVSVTVNLPMDDAAPNLLRFFGIDLIGKELTTTYVTRKE